VKTLVKGRRVSGYLQKDGDCLVLESAKGSIKPGSDLSTDDLPLDVWGWLEKNAMGQFVKVHVSVSETTYRCEIEIRKETR